MNSCEVFSAACSWQIFSERAVIIKFYKLITIQLNALDVYPWFYSDT